MAPKQEFNGSNLRLRRMFLKQRSKCASQLLWPKSRFKKIVYHNIKIEGSHFTIEVAKNKIVLKKKRAVSHHKGYHKYD